MSGILTDPNPRATLSQRQTSTRVEMMAFALKNAMATDTNGRVIVVALMTILEANPDLMALFEDLCGNFVVKVTMHEHARWLADVRRTEKDIR